MCYRFYLIVPALMLAGCRPSSTSPATAKPPSSSAAPKPSKSPFQFQALPKPIESPGAQPADALTADNLGVVMLTDESDWAGISFVYANGARGENLMVESIGGGAGWLDYDGDQRWDLYLTQGGDPRAPLDDASQPRDRLFRNRGDGAFCEVTPSARILEMRYSQGVAVGDFDNDGFDDLYVTNVGPNRLYRNQGDGTFMETTSQAEVGDPRWSTSAAWGDLDRDGDLDLYVCNYCAYDPEHPIDCRDAGGKPRICHPKDVIPWPDECLINDGDETFTRQSQERKLFGEGNRALGVAIADFNNDQWPDVYVANDTTPNFLFLNQKDGTFVESASWLGCAVDRNGNWQASMGLGVGDYDHDGWLDLYSTHYREESNTLYHNLGGAGFQDVTGLAGLHEPTLPFLGFGTVMLDLDHDGRLELFVTNGHIDPAETVYEMAPQLFVCEGARWREVSQASGEFFRRKLVGRGVAAADYDDDGDIDLAVVHQNSPTALLRNDSPPHSWLKFRFRGRQSNRRGVGVRVTVRAEGAVRMQELCGGTSFASSHQPELNFGLGAYHGKAAVEVRWPTGAVQMLEGVEVNQLLVLDEPPG